MSAVTVNTIYQDSQDFIWIGTQDGLNRYDGYHFKAFKNDPFNPKSISSNDVKCILEDKKVVVINKFSVLESRIQSLLEIIQSLVESRTIQVDLRTIGLKNKIHADELNFGFVVIISK